MVSKYITLLGISFVSNFIVATTIFSIPLDECSYYGAYLLMFLYVLANKFRLNIVLDKKYYVVAILFYLPIVLSTFGVLINFFLIDDINYSFKILVNGLPRLFNYFLMLILLFSSAAMGNDIRIKSLKWFYISLLVFLLFGIWQFLHFYFDIPIIFFETRDMAHSVVGVAPTHRVTSIAREPSFFSPLLAELFILSFFLRDIGWSKLCIAIIRFLVLFVAVFTLSPSTYLEFLFIFLVLLFRNKINFLSILAVCFIVIVTVVFFRYFEEFILYRFVTVSDSTRFLQIETIFKTMFDMNVFSLLFGIGPKGLSFISQITQIDGTGAGIHSSTNNIFADLFVDNGLFGFLSLLALFGYLYRKAFAIKLSNLPSLLFVHIFVCCQYRGNYSSIRFIMLINILFILIDYYDKKIKKCNE